MWKQSTFYIHSKQSGLHVQWSKQRLAIRNYIYKSSRRQEMRDLTGNECCISKQTEGPIKCKMTAWSESSQYQLPRSQLFIYWTNGCTFDITLDVLVLLQTWHSFRNVSQSISCIVFSNLTWNCLANWHANRKLNQRTTSKAVVCPGMQLIKGLWDITLFNMWCLSTLLKGGTHCRKLETWLVRLASRRFLMAACGSLSGP